MISPKITSILNGYSSSIFNDISNINKIKYLEKLLEDSKSDPILSVLLDRVKDAEEIRVLGSILKINQGLPTRTSDKYRYIKGIESYLDSTINEDVYTVLRLAKSNNIDQLSKVLLDKFNICYDSKFLENLDKFKEKYSFKVSLLQFLKDEQYKKELINKYEVKKRHFNILRVIDLVPHFREMFKVLGIDSEVLNRLSVRNNLESLILNSIPKKLNNNQILEVRNAIDTTLIEKWIFDKGLKIKVAPKALENDFEYTMTVNNSEQIKKFRTYIEEFVIPLLKEKLPNNKFVKNLVLGLKTVDSKNRIKEPFYKMPFNMTQVDNTERTKLVYEEVLKDFASLNGLKVDGIDMNLVDLFYLYNLIVNRDKFGPNSMTRIFEEVLNTPGNENLLVYDFNSWIDRQDPNELVKLIKVTDKPDNNDLGSKDTSESENATLGFKESPSESDIEESNNEEIVSKIDQKGIIELESVSEYYNTKPSNSSKLIEIIKASDNPYLHLITTEDLVDADNNTKNANGFIQNGEIFINVDKASNDTIIHEFGHLYLADAKLKNPTEYYQLLSKVRQTELWSQMRKMAEYSNKKGSDFDEEVLATMISNYYKNSKRDQNPFYESNNIEDSIVLEALSLVSSSFKELLNSDILPELDGVFFTQYKDQQKIATVKNRLTNDGIIIENCK